MANADSLPPIQGEIIDPRMCDEQAALALVTAGALVAIADRHVAVIERDEVVRYFSHQGLAAHLTEPRLATMFNERALRLEEPDFANVVIEALRPVGTLSLSSEVMAIAERVAVVDDNIHPHELQAIKLLRLITFSLPHSKLVKPARGACSAE
jgi:tellurite resistance protein